MRSSRRAPRPDRVGQDGAATPGSVPDDLVPVGRIGDAWGVAGWAKVFPESAPEDSVLLATADWWLGPPATGGPGAGPGAEVRFPVPFPVREARAHGDSILARPVAELTREAVLALKGRTVLVSRSVFPATEADEFYWVDLIGCTVLDADGEPLGTVRNVDHHGAHAILEVADTAGERHLIPFVEAYVPEVDLEARRIRTEWRRDYSQ